MKKTKPERIAYGSRSEREKTRYALVMNLTGDHNLARRARGWSEDTIYQTYGERVRRGLQLERVDPERLGLNKRKIRRFQFAIDKGIPADEAVRYKHSSFKEIDRQARYLTPRKPAKEIKALDERRMRLDRWRRWGKTKSYPKYIEAEAIEVNRRAGLDDTARYGWAVVFYSYREDESIEFWEEMLQPDEHEGDRYMVVRLT